MPDEVASYWRDECGLFGACLEGSESSGEAARDTYYGLYALQHRGQESAGIAVSNGREIVLHKGMGLVSEVFSRDLLNNLAGNTAVGHVRYSTTGSSHVINAQPLVFSYLKGMVALAHNGNLVNADDLRHRLANLGAVFQTTTDTEVIVNLLARYGQDRLEDGLLKCMLDIKGAYSLIVMTENKLIGLRDPMGFRPLCLGIKGRDYFLSSESCALDTVGAKFVRDIDPGEIVVIEGDGLKSIKTLASKRRAHCIFEYVYLARPDSIIDGISVNRYRRAIGRQLARETQLTADIVIAVPDSGTSAALGFADESGIQFEEGLIKNRYIGRTFIQPSQEMRDLGVRLKLNAVAEAVAGKRVIMVDDSIVRGTTSKQIVNMLRDAGAAEVHMAVASPPTMYPCFYGIDTSHREELIAAVMDVDSICRFIGADSLHYLSMEGLYSSLDRGSSSFCAACFDGCYPVPVEESRSTEPADLESSRGGSL